MRYFVFFYHCNSINLTTELTMNSEVRPNFYGNFPISGVYFPSQSLLKEVAARKAQAPLKNVDIVNWIEFKTREDYNRFFEYES